MNSGLTEVQTSILMTLAHADLFGQPLTLDELQSGLFSPREVGFAELTTLLQNDPLLSALVRHKQGYYFMEGRQALVEVRRLRDAMQEFNASKAKFFLAATASLPWVDSLYQCGPALPGDAADARVHVFLVARPGFGWTAAAAAWIMRFGLGVAPIVTVEQVAEAGSLGSAERDIFTAQRLATLYRLGGPDGGRILAANDWIRDFFANAFVHPHADASHPLPFTGGGRGASVLAGFWAPVELILEGLLGAKGIRPDPRARVRQTAEAFDRAWSVWQLKARSMRDYLLAGEQL